MPDAFDDLLRSIANPPPAGDAFDELIAGVKAQSRPTPPDRSNRFSPPPSPMKPGESIQRKYGEGEVSLQSDEMTPEQLREASPPPPNRTYGPTREQLAAPPPTPSVPIQKPELREVAPLESYHPRINSAALTKAPEMEKFYNRSQNKGSTPGQWDISDLQNDLLMTGVTGAIPKLIVAAEGSPLAQRALLGAANALGGYFSYQMLHGGKEMADKGMEALKQHDYLGAFRYAGAGGLAAAMGALGLKEATRYGTAFEPRAKYEARQAGLPPSERDLGMGGTRGPVEPEVVPPEAEPKPPGGLKPAQEPVEATAEQPAAPRAAPAAPAPPAPQAAPPAPQAPEVPELLQEARQRLSDIQAMQEHLQSGQDVQMSPLTMQHTTPEERRQMLAENISAHQEQYQELWGALEKDLGEKATAELRAQVEQTRPQTEQTRPQTEQTAPAAIQGPKQPELQGLLPITTTRESPQPAGPIAAPAEEFTPQAPVMPRGVETSGTEATGQPRFYFQGVRTGRKGGASSGWWTDQPGEALDFARKEGSGGEVLVARAGDFPPEAFGEPGDESGEKLLSPAEYAKRSAHVGVDPKDFQRVSIADFERQFTPQGPVMPKTPEATKPEAAAPEKHDYSSTQANLPPHIAEPLQRFAAEIPDDKLGEDGRETESHVTVKYGLHGEDAAPVQKLLANEPPITATLGTASIFSNDDADVLKVDVDSPDLHRLNAAIAKLPHTDPHPDYKPHVTIAYLKPGEGKKYDGKDIPGVTGQQVTLPSVTFSSKNGQKTDIPLTGTTPAQPAPAPDGIKNTKTDTNQSLNEPPTAGSMTPHQTVAEEGLREPNTPKPFGSERGSFSLKPLTNDKLKRALENKSTIEESTESKQGGRGLWINPKGEALPLKAEEGVATHGTTALKLTGKSNAAEASAELLNKGHVRVRGNSIEFSKAAGPRAILKAVDEAKQNAEDAGQDSLIVEGNGHWAEVPINQAMRFAHNPVAYLERSGQRGAVPMRLRPQPFARFTGVRALIQKQGSRLNALAALRAAADNPSVKNFGEKVRTFVTGERDIRIAETNQLREKLQRIVKDPLSQEALSLMRDFKHRPGELESFLDGTHPFYDEIPLAERAEAIERVEKLAPVIERALNPTPEMETADKAMTRYFTEHLAEGKKLGFLDSTISNDEYITHLLQPKEAKPGLVKPMAKSRVGPRNFKYAKSRVFPTVLHAVAFNRRPRTLNAFDALTIYGDKFAGTAAARILVKELKNVELGKWGTLGDQKAGYVPKDWVELAPEGRMFRNEVPYLDKEGKPRIAQQTFFVPPQLAEAMLPIFDPNYMSKVHGFMPARMHQAYLKAVELGLSFFHLKALNMSALGNEGATGIVETYANDMKSPEFLAGERAFIRAGGTTSVLGRTWEAYRALQPTSVPTRAEVIRGLPGIKQVDQIAAAITHLTFDVVQRKMKVTDFALKTAAWMAKHPEAERSEQFEAERLIAKEINAVYGGLHWENMGVNRMTLELSKAFFLAPDWTFSNFVNAKYAFAGGPGGKAARLFWLKSAILGYALTQAISFLLTQKASKHPTEVHLGQNKDGKDLYQNIFFVGAPGDLVTLANNVETYGAVVGLAHSIAGKLGPFAKTGVELAANTDPMGRPIAPRNEPAKSAEWKKTPAGHAIANTGRGAAELGKNLMPAPFSVSTITKMLIDKDHEHTPAEYAATLLNGRPPRVEQERKGGRLGAPIGAKTTTMKNLLPRTR